MHMIHITILVGLRPSKIRPPANFSQFKHCIQGAAWKRSVSHYKCLLKVFRNQQENHAEILTPTGKSKRRR